MELVLHIKFEKIMKSVLEEVEGLVEFLAHILINATSVFEKVIKNMNYLT